VIPFTSKAPVNVDESFVLYLLLSVITRSFGSWGMVGTTTWAFGSGSKFGKADFVGDSSDEVGLTALYSVRFMVLSSRAHAIDAWKRGLV
jgi:hypothetical protein